MKSEHVGEGQCVMDLQYRIVECSGGYASLLGLSEDMRGRRVIYSYRMEEELEKMGEYRGTAVIRGGDDISYYVDVHLVRDGSGIILKDMHVRSVVNLNFWEKMFYGMPIPTMILTHNHIIVDLNNEMLSILNKPREEILGTHCYTLIHETEAPPEECPLLATVTQGLEYNLNIMDTVFGKFLISVVNVDGELYAHYAIREGALLVDMQGRMMDILKRYNRILLAATAINEEMLKRKDVDDIIKSIHEKLKGIEGFIGGAVYFEGEDGIKECFSTNVDVSPREIMDSLGDDRVASIQRNGSNYYVFLMIKAPRRAALVLNLGEDTLTDDEIKTILTSMDHFGEYITTRRLESKREMAYQYITNVMSDFAMLVDRIRNPLATIMATAEVEIEDDRLRDKIVSKVEEIQEITRKIDELWNRAEVMKKQLEEK